MTDLDAPPLAGAPSARAALAPPPSPVARRLAPPRWRDGRLLAGLLLLLVSVVVGARVVAGSDSTSPVVAVARDLPIGHVVDDGDLTVAQVRLTGSTSAAYVAGRDLAGIRGRVLARSVRAGELLAVGAVAAAASADQRVVPLKVRDGRLPTLSAGDRVDVYATATVGRPSAAPAPAGAPAAPGPGTGCATVLVAAGLEVAADAAAEQGSADLTVLLRVAPEQSALLVHASETAALDVVRHLGPDQPAHTSAPALPPVTGLAGLASGACAAGR